MNNFDTSILTSDLGWFYCLNIVCIIILKRMKNANKSEKEKLEYVYRFTIGLFFTGMLLSILRQLFI